MNRFYFIIGFLIFSSISVFAQKNRYVVYFIDKNESVYSSDDPEEFLSFRALERREKMGIPVVDEDLPVNSNYLDSLRNKGVAVYHTSRWFNLALIEATVDEADLLENISIVERVEYVAPGEKLDGGRMSINLRMKSSTNQQNSFTNINQMHDKGLTGEGIWIAVFDGGFSGVDNISAFSHLYEDGRLIMAKNFIENDDDVYQYSDHGTQVLSLIAGYDEGTFIGGAYDASVGLFVTEETATEYRIEEYNWLFAAEMADSAGFDIINTSLGYNTFDDPSMNYTYEDMDGKTSIIARASNMATARGILTVTSAGNEGNIDWKYITTPADAFGNIAVGAVTYQHNRPSYSSIGPSADGRIKPDISTIGSGLKVINGSGNIVSGSGTSFAAPIATSIIAGAWQEYRELSLAGIRNLIFSWGTQADEPDNIIGHGILTYKGEITSIEPKITLFKSYPNPVRDIITIELAVKPEKAEVFDLAGNQYNLNLSNQHQLNVTSLSTGVYFLKIYTKDQVFVTKFVKE